MSAADTRGNLAVRPRPRMPEGAAGRLCDRILVHTGVTSLQLAAQWVDPDISGLWVGGRRLPDRIARWLAGYPGVMVLDPEAYTTSFASPDAVFALPAGQLFATLDDVLDEQLRAGATVAVTPTRYLGAGDSRSLRALVSQARTIERDDTILVVPFAVDWLGPVRFGEFRDTLASVSLPIALMFGGQHDPLERFASAVRRVRLLERELPHVMRARTDLAAFDGLAHGSFAGAVGFGGSRRHLVPPGSPHDASRRTPSVLVPHLMRYVHSDELAERLHRGVPRCSCAACEDRSLGGFLHEADRDDADAHNLCIWTQWLRELHDHDTLVDRAFWWRAKCRAALDEHERLDTVHGYRVFPPRRALRRYAEEAPWPAASSSP
ncbi:MAG TPA: hypothetical protein VI076_01475 [Actinopolymorphaceae bacterium]